MKKSKIKNLQVKNLLSPIQEQMLKLIEVIETQQKVYDKINDQLQQLSPDFPNRIELIDEKVRSELHKAVDLALNEVDFIGYYLYEAGDNRCVYPDYKKQPKLKFKLTCPKELRDYFIAKNRGFK